jgi:AraC-like DNA-binding protein
LGQPDVLSEVLRVLEVVGSVQVRAVASGNWGVHFEAGSPAIFHLVAHGRCWVRVPDHAPVQMVPGEVVLVRAGVAHDIVNSPTGATRRSISPASRPLYHTVSYHLGRGRAECVFICGALHFASAAQHPLLTQLPVLLHVTAADAPEAIELGVLLRQMQREATDGRPGADLIVRRLSDVFFVQILRAWFERQPVGGGWLAAVSDPQIGVALRSIHNDPRKHWSVAALAREAALSRSLFAARFAQLCGEPPMHYVARWRILLAAEPLRDGRETVASIATSVGYASVSSFVHHVYPLDGREPGQLSTPRTAGRLGRVSDARCLVDQPVAANPAEATGKRRFQHCRHAYSCCPPDAS